jgi:hypothetical protein
MPRKKDLELNEKRINCAIRCFALTANYIGLADGKFDEKEKEEAKQSTAIFSNWDSLFYMDKEDVDENQIRSKIEGEIDLIANSKDGAVVMLDELKKQFEIAKTLTKYPKIVDKNRGGTADYEKDVSTYTSREELQKIIKAENLDIDEDDCNSEDGFDLDHFHNLVLAELSDPFASELRHLLCIFGCCIAAASGGFMGFGKMRSKKEVQAIYDIVKAWGYENNDAMSESAADNLMMFYDHRAEMVKQFSKSLRKMF